MRTLAATLAALALAAVACGSPEAAPAPAPPAASSASSSAEPNTEAGAMAAAKLYADDYSAGDYGPAWDRWTLAAQAVITRADYERLFTLCPQVAEGVPFTVKQATLTKDGARVRLERATFLTTVTYAYEGGRWRYVPEAANLAGYRLGVDKLAAKRRAAGECGEG